MHIHQPTGGHQGPAGPSSPPSSRPGTGMFSPTATGYTVGFEPSRTTAHRMDAVIEEGDELRYDVYPEFGDVTVAQMAEGHGFEATAVAVDLEFDDGTRLSDLLVVDEADYAITAEAQYASRALMADQWNEKVVDLAPAAGRRVVAAQLTTAAVSPPGTARGWVSDIRIVAAEPDAGVDPVDLVDTRRGTHASAALSRGNNIPAVAVPHGFNFVTPAMDASDMRWPYQFHALGDADNRCRLEALAISHMPSPWVGDRGVLDVMPLPRTTLPRATVSRADGPAGRSGRGLGFSHADETARPYLYRVCLDGGIVAETTATDHVVAMRFRLPAGGGVLIDHPDGRGRIHVDPDDPRAQVRGWSDSAADPANPTLCRMYYAIRADRPVSPAQGRGMRRHAARRRRRNSAVLGFEGLGLGGGVELRIATSFIGVDQALHSLDLEAPASRSFDDLAADCRAAWARKLSLIRIEDPHHDRRVSFASDLYRMFLYPNNAAENAGTAEDPRWVHVDASGPRTAPDGDAGTGRRVCDGRSFVNNGFWDTYRTVWPAYNLLDPADAADLLDGFVAHYRDGRESDGDGGWIERWSAPGPINAMVGTSADVVIADAMAAGVPLPDAGSAYDAGVRDATTVSRRPETGRAGNDRALFLGYVPNSIGEGMSWSLESALSDYAIARASEWMLAHARPDDPRRDEYAANRAWFDGRAANYLRLFEPVAGFFRGRDDAGRFPEPLDAFDPRAWGGDYTETNACGMSFSAPHDGNGLAFLYGGPEGLEAALDGYFAAPETARFPGAYGAVIHEMVEARNIRMGMFGLSNQPAHHIAYMYAFTGSPYKTQAIVREAVRRLFGGSAIGQGYPGDEDNGEMSAWYVFSGIGLYPLIPGSGELVITSPSVPRATIDWPCGGETTITAHHLSPDNVYIQQVRIDGRAWEHLSVPIATLRAARRIDVDLGPAPSSWGSGPENRPPSLTPPGVAPQILADLTSPAQAVIAATSAAGHAHRAFNDTSADGVELRAGQEIVYDLGRSEGIEMYTVSLGPASPAASWALEVGDDGRTWRRADEQHGVGYRWPRQTRAFIPARPAAGRYVRLVACCDLDLRQLEYLRHRPWRVPGRPSCPGR